MKKLILSITIVCIFLAVKGQVYSPWKYIPKIQADSTNVYTYFKLNNEVVKFITPSDGQMLVRKLVSGKHIWTNSTVNALGYDSIRFDIATGNLKGYRGGVTNTASTANLNGKYTLIPTFEDSIAALRGDLPTGMMLKAVYDPANVQGQLVNTTSAQTLSNKTLTIPTITNYTNANHDHSTAVQGGLINSDDIVQGTDNLFSPFTESSGNFILPSGKIGIGKIPGVEFDVLGTSRAIILEASGGFTLNGVAISSIQTGTSDNDKLPTKGWVTDQIVSAGGYTDEQAQDAVGAMIDNGTVGDVIFTYSDGTPKLSGEVENDSHNHTGSTISGLSVSDFTSPNVSNWTNDANYIGSGFALTGDLSGTMASPAIANGVIVNSDINSAAGIDATKLGAGTVNNTELGYLDGAVVNIQGQLDDKVGKNVAITGSTKTKITYDSKGLVTSGANAMASDIVNTPAGNIAGTNVQLALDELDSEKIPTSYLDVDGTLASNSDVKIASQKASKTYIDGKVSDLTYDSGWNGITTVAPSKNAVYDKINQFEHVSYNPSSTGVNTGTLIQGSNSVLAALGGTDLIVQEATGSDPLRITFTFTAVERMTSFAFYGNYSGGASHIINVEIYNPNTTTWFVLGQFSTNASKQWYSFNIFQPNQFISAGSVQVRINHQNTGVNTHTLTLDYVDVNYGGAGGGTSIGASSIVFTPSGNVSSTNVQSAISEVDSEKQDKPTVQSLSGTTPTWNVNSGINATLTLSGNTTITLSNLVAGTSGNLTITNAASTYTLTFSGYTNKISPAVYSSANTVLTSGGSKIDVYSWYYDGTRLLWNGGQDYK